jgi:hypothetical protein
MEISLQAQIKANLKSGLLRRAAPHNDEMKRSI